MFPFSNDNMHGRKVQDASSKCFLSALLPTSKYFKENTFVYLLHFKMDDHNTKLHTYTLIS